MLPVSFPTKPGRGRTLMPLPCEAKAIGAEGHLPRRPGPLTVAVGSA
jgi:hypothetical protein